MKKRQSTRRTWIVEPGISATSVRRSRRHPPSQRPPSTDPQIDAGAPGRQIAVYLASPISLFWTARYEAGLVAVRRRFTISRVLEPRALFSSGADWRAAWPHVLDDVDALVLLAERDGSVGLGCFCEVLESRARRIPTHLYHGRTFRDRFSLALIDGGRDLVRFARVEIDARATLSLVQSAPAAEPAPLTSGVAAGEIRPADTCAGCGSTITGPPNNFRFCSRPCSRRTQRAKEKAAHRSRRPLAPDTYSLGVGRRRWVIVGCNTVSGLIPSAPRPLRRTRKVGPSISFDLQLFASKPQSSRSARTKLRVAHQNVAEHEERLATLERKRPRTRWDKGWNTRYKKAERKALAAARSQLTRAKKAVAAETASKRAQPKATKAAATAKRSAAGTKSWETRRARTAEPAVSPGLAIPFLTSRGVVWVWPPSESDRKKVGRYWNAIDTFLSTGWSDPLDRFAGDSIYDEISGKRLPFITDPIIIIEHRDEYDFGPSFYRDRRGLRHAT